MMLLALAATLAIVVRDHTPLRAAPQSGAVELTTLWQGDVIEVRGERAGYLKVYDYRRERAGYMRSEVVRPVALSETAAPELLAVLRFLRDSSGSEALGISYGAAYLKAAPPKTITAEAFSAIAGMAERLADHASAGTVRFPDTAAHLEVVEQFGIRMRSFERNGRTQVCYDGELYRRVLAVAGATAEERARAALSLTRPDCIDPGLGPVMRAAFDAERRELLEEIDERQLSATTKSRLLARRAGVWAAVAFEQARRGEAAGTAAQRGLADLLAVNAGDLGEDLRAEYSDAAVRVGAVRWAVAIPSMPVGPLRLRAAAGEPGQTCVILGGSRDPNAVPLVRRCTYGIVWLASAQPIAQGRALVLAVQPLESWRELWVFRQARGGWRVDVLSPGTDDPEEGYIEYAGFSPGKRRLLVAREIKERGRFRRRFEELRLEDLALVRQASSPELLSDFGRWQDVAWRRDTLTLR
ncbi:MAG TPA: hypothetical protein VFO44_01795 [Steroidobacteraceae bacterium]|nr:hypothetical protein [Steroidobacteraceae bacterium]